jgi:hypothetical protein
MALSKEIYVQVDGRYGTQEVGQRPECPGSDPDDG